jgi:hypothetical protein
MKKRLTAFISYAEGVILNMLASLALGAPFALIYFALSYIALDILLPVSGTRFFSVWLATGSFSSFFTSLDSHDLGAAWLLRVDILALIALFIIGWPAGCRLRRSFVNRTPISVHAGLLSDRLSFAILLIPVAIGICAVGEAHGWLDLSHHGL